MVVSALVEVGGSSESQRTERSHGNSASTCLGWRVGRWSVIVEIVWSPVNGLRPNHLELERLGEAYRVQMTVPLPSHVVEVLNSVVSVEVK